MTSNPLLIGCLVMTGVLQLFSIWRLFPLRRQYGRLQLFMAGKILRILLLYAAGSPQFLAWISAPLGLLAQNPNLLGQILSVAWIGTEAFIEFLEIRLCVGSYWGFLNSYPGPNTKRFAGRLLRNSLLIAAAPCLTAAVLFPAAAGFSWQYKLVHVGYIVRQFMASSCFLMMMMTWSKIGFLGGYAKRNVILNWWALTAYFFLNAVGFFAINTKLAGTSLVSPVLIVGEFLCFCGWAFISKSGEWLPTYSDEEREKARVELPELERQRDELSEALARAAKSAINSALGKHPR